MKFAIWQCCLAYLVSMAAPAAIAQIDTSRGGNVSMGSFATKYGLVSGNESNLRLVPDPAGSARQVFEIRVGPNDPHTFGALRTEVAANRDYTREGVRWYAMSLYFPSSWRPHPYPTVVAQVHTSQKTAVLSPPLAIVVHGSNIDLELYANHRPVDTADPATRANSARQLIRLDALRTAHWYCFVVRADWSTRPGSGAIRIWMNGDNVYESSNLYNSYETWLGNYPRVGIYMPGKPSVLDRLIFADFIHVGGSKTGLDEMAALTPCGRPRQQEVSR